MGFAFPRSISAFINAAFIRLYLDEEDISMNTIAFGHESLDVTLAYLKGKDAESEEAQETCEQQQPSAVRVNQSHKLKTLLLPVRHQHDLTDHASASQ
jgi:hypothetical protein